MKTGKKVKLKKWVVVTLKGIAIATTIFVATEVGRNLGPRTNFRQENQIEFIQNYCENNNKEYEETSLYDQYCEINDKGEYGFNYKKFLGNVLQINDNEQLLYIYSTFTTTDQKADTYFNGHYNQFKNTIIDVINEQGYINVNGNIVLKIENIAPDYQEHYNQKEYDSFFETVQSFADKSAVNWAKNINDIDEKNAYLLHNGMKTILENYNKGGKSYEKRFIL